MGRWIERELLEAAGGFEADGLVLLSPQKGEFGQIWNPQDEISLVNESLPLTSDSPKVRKGMDYCRFAVVDGRYGMAGKYVILDKHGDRFAVEVDVDPPLSRFKVFDPIRGGPQIGHVNLWGYCDSTLKIMEITIEERVLTKNLTPVLNWFRPRVAVNYRGRGLGSALLECVIQHAKAVGASTLEIERVSGFANNALDLPMWYASKGFSMGPNGRLRLDIGTAAHTSDTSHAATRNA